MRTELVEIKDVEIPEPMQWTMAREAEVIREKRARISEAEAELEVSIKLTQGAKQMEQSPQRAETTPDADGAENWHRQQHATRYAPPRTYPGCQVPDQAGRPKQAAGQ